MSLLIGGSFAYCERGSFHSGNHSCCSKLNGLQYRLIPFEDPGHLLSVKTRCFLEWKEMPGKSWRILLWRGELPRRRQTMEFSPAKCKRAEAAGF